MFRHIALTLFCSLVFIFSCSHIYAADIPNNKFGIHLTQPSNEDLQKAADLVNSNGGRWGYVTVVIQENDRDKKKWTELFQTMRKLRLIPIVRLATHPEGAHWRRPNMEDAKPWADFLDSLPWVTKERYVLLFNETNHGAEWGGATDPEGFADITKHFAEILKKKNSSFFVMLGGFDASAPSAAPTYEDEAVYFRRVIDRMGANTFNQLFDGLSSHSYPNPAFAGSPLGGGKGSVRTYEWELDYLRGMGVKDLPVFITETGWDAYRVSQEGAANNMRTVFQNVWQNDNRVKAVTPFVLNYPAEPFAKFSWMHENGEFVPQYHAVKELSKTAGRPEIHESGAIEYELPKELVSDSTYTFKIKLKNQGQALWAADEYALSADFSSLVDITFGEIPEMNPGDEKTVDMHVKTKDIKESSSVFIHLQRGNSNVLSGKQWNFTVVAVPSFEFRVSFYPKLKADANDVELQIFNKDEELVYRKTKVNISKGIGVISEVKNIALGEKYRVVILRPYYLPRQKHITFKSGKNEAGFTMMLPFDFNKDGAWTGQDVLTLLKDLKLIRNLIPSSK